MSIIDDYNELANKIIREDEEVIQYEKDLDEKRTRITSLLRGSDLRVFLHPIRLIRLSTEKRRLIRIGEDFDELKKTTVLNNMDEESGVLEEDLHNSAYYFKPKRIRAYMKQNRIYDEDIDKKLSLVKK